jgi:hypothetical protein
MGFGVFTKSGGRSFRCGLIDGADRIVRADGLVTDARRAWPEIPMNPTTKLPICQDACEGSVTFEVSMRFIPGADDDGRVQSSPESQAMRWMAQELR